MKTFLEEMPKLSRKQQTYMNYLLETMPESDKAYPFELFLSVVDHGLMVKEKAGWCKALPDWMFREYVLYHRVNDEDLSNMRPVFFDELWHRVKEKTMEEAVLEVNRWCHEKATYQEQDDRTASPETVYKSGSGRCGEESAFAVTALRSVGIPARQVYAPRWSHCDDNHAWVEAYCDGEWRFFGACEPEPVLDKGWFNTAAARAMLVHTRTFGREDRDSRPLGTEGSVTYWNQTGRYADTKTWSFQVEEDGAAIGPGGLLRLSVLNEGRFMTISQLALDDTGKASLEMGLGDLWVEAVYQGRRVEQLCKGNEFSSFTIELSKGAVQESETEDWFDFDFLAPSGSGKTAPALSREQKLQREETAKHGNKMRDGRLKRLEEEAQAALMEFFDDCRGDRELTEVHQDKETLVEIFRLSRGNWQQLIQFLRAGDEPERISLLQELSRKDYRDVTAAVLEDHLQGALKYRHQYQAEIFCQSLLNPRIAFEPLTPWRDALVSLMGSEVADTLRRDPCEVTHLLKARLSTVAEDEVYPNLYFDPVFALEGGTCDEKSMKVLAVALLRSVGVPARLTKKDQSLQYYSLEKQDFLEVPWHGGQEGGAGEAGEEATRLVLKKEKNQVFTYRQNWSLSKLSQDGWHWLDLTDENFTGDELELTLQPGVYRLITSNRLPKGDQLAAVRTLRLQAGKRREAELYLRGYSVKDMLGKYELPSFSACDEKGGGVESRELTRGRPLLLFWLEEGAEPTEHVVNEWRSHMSESEDRGEEMGADVVFFLREKESANQATLASLLSVWQDVKLLYGDWEFNMELMARHLSCNPEQPPLAVVADKNGSCVYGSSGYNVGLVKLLLEMARLTEE